jgi:uncharacterized protein
MTPDYAMMQQLLRTTMPDLTPAALHGILSGLLSSGAPDVDSEDVATLLQVELPKVVAQLVDRLFETTRIQLQQQDFSFQLLLPNDDEALVVRASAFGQWCEGFTTGFAAGFAQPESVLGSDGREAIEDIGELAGLSEDGANALDDEEGDLMELVEYVRLASAALFQQLATPLPSEDDNNADSSPVLH